MRVRVYESMCFALFVWSAAGCTGVAEQTFELTALNQANSTSEDGVDDDGPEIICEPGQTRWMDTGWLEACSPTGREWEALDSDAHASEDATCSTD